MNAAEWNARYVDGGDLPWDTGRPDRNLVNWIEAGSFDPCPVLELGCGTGTNALWLDAQGFKVTGADISERAIELANRKKVKAGARVEFRAADVLELRLDPAAFGLVIDRGCFHSFVPVAQRIAFVQTAAYHLRQDGLWISIIGSTDGPPRESGPPRRSAQEIATVLEPWFEILSLKTSYFDSSHEPAPRCWVCVARKRELT